MATGSHYDNGLAVETRESSLTLQAKCKAVKLFCLFQESEILARNNLRKKLF